LFIISLLLVVIGCVVIEMASGNDPWSEKKFTSSFQAIFHIGSSNESPLIPSTLSEIGQDFVRKCLIRNPDQRPSARELLKHPFIVGDNSQINSNCSKSDLSTPVSGHRSSSSLSNSAAAQLAQLQVMVDTQLRTLDIASSLVPNPDAPIINVQQHSPSSPSQVTDELDHSIPPPLPCPFTMTNSPDAMDTATKDSAVVGTPKSMLVSSNAQIKLDGFDNQSGSCQFTVIYNFGTPDKVDPPISNSSSVASDAKSVLSRIYQYQPVSSVHSHLDGSVDSSLSLPSSVLAFVDGVNTLNLEEVPGQRQAD
jgi:serine/threonine protein kinase